MQARETFDQDCQGYHRWRPDYPRELLEAVIRYSGAAAGTAVLEIGAGTGKATAPFVERGCRVTAVELGPQLAEFVGRRFAGAPGFGVLQGDFIDLALPAGGFELVLSATAFHWLDHRQALPRVRDCLAPGGTLALFWNHPNPNRPEDPTNRVNRQVYRRHRPDSAPPPEFCPEDCRLWEQRLAQCGFEQIESRLFHRVRELEAEAYLGLIGTYSDHRMLPRQTREAFERDMRESLGRVGGRIRIYDTLDLYLARKP